MSRRVGGALTFAVLVGLAAIAAVLPARADEVWSSPMGEIVYERDLSSGEAVMSFPVPESDGLRGLAYVAGLAGVYSDRGDYIGVWIVPPETGEPNCPFALANPETGEPTRHWGWLRAIFVNPDFPSPVVAQFGGCLGPVDQTMVAQPIVGPAGE